MTDSRPLLLDSTFLIAYERELTRRRAQDLVVEAVLDGRILVVPAMSLTAAGAELGGRPPELSWLLNDAEGPVQVLSLSDMNALDVGVRAARASALDLVALEVAHVAHGASSIHAVVLTYEPKLYVDHALAVMDVRPQ